MDASLSSSAASFLFIQNPSPLLQSFPLNYQVPKATFIPLLSFASIPASSRLPTSRLKMHIPRRCPASLCTSRDMEMELFRPLGLLIEVDGVLADVSRLGNRQAFNVAFQKLGLDCANWPESIYTDLKKKTAADEERMLTLFFSRIGWPTSLPTNEQETFLRNVMREKKKALEDFAMSSNFLLRPGVETFIDEAIKEGLPLVLLTAYSKVGDDVCRSIIEKLGPDRAFKVNVIGKEEVQQSFYGQLALGKGVSSSLDEQLAKELRKAVSVEKQRVAENVASILNLSVDIDTSSTERTELIVATLRAGTECAGLPVQDCVLIAGSQSGVIGAEKVGMPSIVIRNSSTARAEFPLAKAVMDGFGGADLTVSKLLNKRFNNPVDPK